MASGILKSEKTEYKGVYKHYNNDGTIKFRVLLAVKTERFHKKATKNTINGSYDTLREAAIAVDTFLISKGKEPVNILKKKQ